MTKTDVRICCFLGTRRESLEAERTRLQDEHTNALRRGDRLRAEDVREDPGMMKTKRRPRRRDQSGELTDPTPIGVAALRPRPMSRADVSALVKRVRIADERSRAAGALARTKLR